MRTSVVRAVAVTLFSLLIASVAAAQGTTSRVVGMVTDSTGGRVPGATVTLTNDATGVSLSTVTTDSGTYAFESVQVGSYTIAVELQGFKKFVSSANAVNIGEPTTVNATLQPGGLSQSVEVKSSSEIVQTNTSGNIGTTFDQRTIESLPIVGGRGRNPLDLVLTEPGVVSGANTGGGVHVNGARDRSWNYTLDGIDSNESSAGGSDFSPLRTNPDALAEFKVLTGNTTAEYGRNSGGQVAMITRSGTNTFSGTGYYFDRRTPYNANEWQNNINHLPKAQFTQYMPGFSLGGPIRHNKTFFFVNAQWLDAKQTRQRTRLVYTAQARAGLWRYAIGAQTNPSGVPGASVDANGNPIVPIGTYNVVANDPQHLGLDPTTQKIIGMTQLPNNFSTGDGLNVAGYNFVAPEREHQMDFVAKIDHTINVHHSMFARISKGHQNTDCDSVNGGEPPFPGLTCLVNTKRSPYNWAANWRWNPGGTVVNEFVMGQNHFTFDFQNPSADPAQVTYSFGSITLPQDFTHGNARTIDTLQFVDNFSWQRGAHSLRFGTNMRFQKHTDTRGSIAGQNADPIADFSTGVDSVDPVAFGIPGDLNTKVDRPALQSSINFLLGRVGNLTQGFVQQGDVYAPGGSLFHFVAEYPEIDAYAQDIWKPWSNVTIDAGLRWEAKLSPRNPDNLIRLPNQSMAVGSPPSSTLSWVTGKLYNDSWNNIGPATGISWDPRHDGKSAVRGNYRLAFDRIDTFLFSSNIFQSIPGISAAVVNTSFGQAGGRVSQGLPSLAPSVAPASFLQPPVPSSASIRVVDPNFQTPRTHEWALSYERELFRQNLLEVAYIGRSANHLFGAYNVNQVEYRTNGFLDAFKIVQAGGESPLIDQLLANDTRRNTGETGSQMVRRLFASNLQLNAVASLAAAIGTRIQNGQTLAQLAGLSPYFFFPYPQFLGGVNVIDSNDRSRYNALEVKLERRFVNDLSYLVAYTLSRSMDTRSFDPAFSVVSTGNAQSASSTPFDIFHRSLNYAPSDFDRTHVFQAQVVYELPFGSSGRFGKNAGHATDQLISGWVLSGQLVAQTGRPMTVYSGANTFSNIVQTPANCTGCAHSMGSVHDEGGLVWYFNPDARAKFSTPAPGEFSNVGRNFFRGPGGYGVNMSLAKRTRVMGSRILEIRADSTNVLNHPIFDFPTLTTTSPTFGRIRDNLYSTARQIMLGVKYYF